MGVPSLSAEIGFGRQMDEQHADRAANSARAMTTATDIVGEEYFAAATPVLLPVAGFNFEGARKHEEKLPPGSGVPSGISVTIVLCAGNIAERRAV